MKLEHKKEIDSFLEKIGKIQKVILVDNILNHTIYFNSQFLINIDSGVYTSWYPEESTLWVFATSKIREPYQLFLLSYHDKSFYCKHDFPFQVWEYYSYKNTLKLYEERFLYNKATMMRLAMNNNYNFSKISNNKNQYLLLKIISILKKNEPNYLNILDDELLKII